MSASAFLGTGWRFPLRPDPFGRLGYVSGEENVDQSLLILLQTAVGERVMRYDFGSRAPQLVFAPGSLRYLRLLEQTVSDALRTWEPRIDVDSVQAEVDLDDDSRVNVRVDYRIRRTNTRRNLVYPYYVTAGVQP